MVFITFGVDRFRDAFMCLHGVRAGNNPTQAAGGHRFPNYYRRLLGAGGTCRVFGDPNPSGSIVLFKPHQCHRRCHGRAIAVIAYDDGYDPPRCVANTQKLIVEDAVFALFCYVGTPTTVKIIPLVTEAEVPLVGMFTGANALRNPPNRYLINVRASYYQETDAAIEHLVNTLGVQTVAIFYQYDAYGFDGLRVTELALKAHGMLPTAKGTYIRGTLDAEKGLEKIMAAKADAVVMIGSYDPCAKFIRLARAGASGSIAAGGSAA